MTNQLKVAFIVITKLNNLVQSDQSHVFFKLSDKLHHVSIDANLIANFELNLKSPNIQITSAICFRVRLFDMAKSVWNDQKLEQLNYIFTW